MNIENNKVLKFFSEISDIPRGSKNTKAISDYIVRFAKERELKYIQDDVNNVIIFKSGNSNKKTIMLQAHLDMVNEKTSDSNHDFEKDGLELVVEEDFLFAKDTTLGADDGIGVAMILAALEEENKDIPNIEAVFTIDEEIGMIGANAIDLSMLKADYLINLDSEKENEICVGCAGGASVVCKLSDKKKKITGNKMSLTITGLEGGHSGTTIHMQKANAVNIIGRILSLICNEVDINIISINGGTKDNVITNEAFVDFIYNCDEKAIKDKVIALFEKIKYEYRKVEENMKLIINSNDNVEENAFSNDFSKKITAFFNIAPYGVIDKSYYIKDLVETSANPGITKTFNNNGNDIVECVISVRSSVASKKNLIINRINDLVKLCSGKMSIEGEYPEWDYDDSSELVKQYKKLFIKNMGYEPDIIAIHAGLECGYILSKMKNIDIISVGPRIDAIHSTNERLSISSTNKTYKLLVDALITIE